MKKHSKVGNRQGKPAYRTPSGFIVRKTAYLWRPPRMEGKVQKASLSPKRKGKNRAQK